jgi:hypothetical protein
MDKHEQNLGVLVDDLSFPRGTCCHFWLSYGTCTCPFHFVLCPIPFSGLDNVEIHLVVLCIGYCGSDHVVFENPYGAGRCVFGKASGESALVVCLSHLCLCG